MSTTDAVLANRAALADHNARVRRLARDYAPKYRPVVLVLGYAEDLSRAEGYTKLKLETINKKAARYRDGKLYSERQLQRLLAELTKTEPSAALKTEATFGRNGHQGATVRYLNHHVAVDRHGFSVIHDWDAPLDDTQDCTAEPYSVTQDVTPASSQMSPLSTVFDLACDLSPIYPGSAGELGTAALENQDQGQGQNQEPGREPWWSERDPKDQPPDSPDSLWNVFYLWRAKSGDLALFCPADQGFAQGMIPRRAISLRLSPEDSNWYYDTWASWGGAGTVCDRATLIARNFATNEELAELGISRHREDDA